MEKEHKELKLKFAELTLKFEKLEKEYKELEIKYEGLKLENKRLREKLEAKTNEWNVLVVRVKELEYDCDQWKFKHSELVVVNKTLTTNIEEFKLTIINL